MAGTFGHSANGRRKTLRDNLRLHIRSPENIWRILSAQKESETTLAGVFHLTIDNSE